MLAIPEPASSSAVQAEYLDLAATSGSPRAWATAALILLSWGSMPVTLAPILARACKAIACSSRAANLLVPG